MNSKHRILIVDDEPLNVKLLAAILSADNFDIISAFNGEQALEKVSEACPDLILLDIMMPGIDGFEVTRRLKGSFETRDIPIILITAFDIADYKVLGHESGADEFLNKPIKAPELKSRVKSLLRTKQCQDRLKRQKQADIDCGCDNNEQNLIGKNDTSLVLLAFDDKNEANSINIFLHGQPYEVIIANTAQDAIVLSNEKQIDLVLLDGMLQGEKCFEICSRLKEEEQTANTQILVVAELDYLENKHEQFELWSDDFLIKPVNVHELRARVKALLKKKTFLDRIYAGPGESVRSAITDSLSGLANKTYLKYFLDHEIKRSFRESGPIALIMMELNEVKNHPNCIGHLAGEELLKYMGNLIKENIRDVDLGARYKEKQFGIVLINTDGNGALLVADRLKGLIQNHFSMNPENMSENHLALHMGIANYPNDADSMDLLINHAEKELFESKMKPE
jgi:two-component system cell cycle response regulator